MNSTVQDNTSCSPIQAIHKEKVIHDSVEMSRPSTPTGSDTPQEAHACAGPGSTIQHIRIASRKAPKSKIQLQEEALQRQKEEDALINAEIQFTSKRTTCERSESPPKPETSNQLNSSIEVHSDLVKSDDDDDYYIVSDYPKSSPAEQLKMLKERLSDKMSEVQAKLRMQHSVARRPAVLSRTRYGQLKAIPPNFDSSTRRKLLEGPLPSSTTPGCKEGEYVQGAYSLHDSSRDELEITDKDGSIELGSQ
ncbi:unnamed protein product [Phytomonas sp. EM1]|nr:unnamed protein product [Phytomonas sp. EM1]|eukprot:CCW64802.1 unnamed protein product [Phytomonas sp. isolate EM1]